MSELYNNEKLCAALKCWYAPGDVFEVRVLDAQTRAYFRPHIESGYFDYDHIEAIPAALEHIKSAKGFYVTVNPVSPELLNRAVNRVRAAGREPTTSDTDIPRRRWLLIDCDAKRAAGIPSSDAEHKAAADKAGEIQAGFRSMGWPEPIVLDSGNGAQLMYRINLPAEDGGIVQKILQSVAAVSSSAVDVDVTVHNPARIWRIPGTMNCKGDSTEERPHRMASVVSIPEHLEIVPEDKLRKAIPATVTTIPTVTPAFQTEFNLERWIAEHCQNVSGPMQWKDGQKWVFDVCPFDANHTNKSAVITQQANGAIAFTCHHNGCKGNDWAKLRDLLEPDRTVPAVEYADVDLSAFFDKIRQKMARKENPFEDPGAMPDNLLSVPGIVDGIVALDLKTAPYPNKMLAFCGALSFVAHLAGRKFRDRRDNFTNIYLIALANSGTGKDHPRKVNNCLAAMAGQSGTMSDSFASGAGLEDSMFMQPAQLFQMDEVDWLFNTLKGAKDAAVSESINEKLLKFYSSASSVYYMRKKALQQGVENHNGSFIYNPCLNLFGTAVPDYFYESLSRRVLENGLVARCLIVEAPKRGHHGTPSSISDSVDDSLLTMVNKLADTTIESSPLGMPFPKEIPETADATALLQNYQDECDNRYDGFEKLHDLAAMALWARAMEKVYKMSMVYALSANSESPQITTDAVRWAFAFVSHVTRQMLFRAGQFCYESKFDQAQKRFLKKLHEFGGTVSHSEIMRYLHLSKTEMREIAGSLIESGQIIQHTADLAGNGREVTVYSEIIR